MAEFSQFEGPGRKYAEMGKKKKKSTDDGRRTPRRDKQVARGIGMAQRGMEMAKKAKRDRGAQYGIGQGRRN